MSELTKEQIEAAFDAFKRDTAIAGIAPVDWYKRIEQCRTLALEALEMRQRPISELPKESCPVLIWPIKLGRWIYAAYFSEIFFEGGWKYSEISHFIPLSSLPKEARP